jgi:hypothetical protein
MRGVCAMRCEDYDPGGCTPGANVQRRERAEAGEMR